MLYIKKISFAGVYLHTNVGLRPVAYRTIIDLTHNDNHLVVKRVKLFKHGYIKFFRSLSGLNKTNNLKYLFHK